MSRVRDEGLALRRLSLAHFGLLSFISCASVAATQTSHGAAIGAVAAVALTVLAYWMLRRPTILSFLGGSVRAPIAMFLILLLLAASNEPRYLAAPHIPHFPSSAPALELPARLLFHGYEPYMQRVTDGVPISPGPGWVALLSPFTLTHLTGVLGAVSLGLAVFLLRREDRYAAAVFFVLLFLQPIFQAQVANGQDLFVVSIALLCLCLAADRLGESIWRALLLGFLAGIVATARLPILIMMCVLGFGVIRKDFRTGSILTVTMLAVGGTIHTLFALWSRRNGHFYQPMHVIARATDRANIISVVAVIALICDSLVWVAVGMKPSASHWMLGIYFVMFSLFTPEAIKEYVITPRLDWEGGTYITFPLPLLISSLVLMKMHARSQATSPVTRDDFLIA